MRASTVISLCGVVERDKYPDNMIHTMRLG